MKKYIFKTELMSSLVHTEEVNSNISNIYREKINISNKIHNIPAIHGNSIRGILRRVGFNRLCELLELEKNTLSVYMYHILFNGGALASQTGYLDLHKKKEIRDTIPLLSVFGSAIGNSMLPGKMIVSSAIPECKELGTGDISYHDITNIVRYTRLEDCEIDTGKDKKSNQMFYDIETMIQGTVLNWEIILDYTTEIEGQAINDTLMQFSKKPFFGGSSAKGHGKIKFDYTGKNCDYLNFIMENSKQIKQFLQNYECI